MGLADYWIDPKNGFRVAEIANNSNSLINSQQGLFSQNNGFLGGLGRMLNSTVNGTKDFFKNTTSKDWRNYANTAGTLGQLGLGYLSYRDNSRLLDKQMGAMDYELQLAKEAEDRRRRNSQNLNTGFSSSALAQYA